MVTLSMPTEDQTLARGVFFLTGAQPIIIYIFSLHLTHDNIQVQPAFVKHTHRNDWILQRHNLDVKIKLEKSLNPPMTTPKKDNLLGDNLYQVPTCTICLTELTAEISSLSCGHCFHYLCISQHFQYRGTCPNCQKRASVKQIRGIVYPLVLNSRTNTHLQNVLQNLSSTSQEKQMEQLLRQLKIQSEMAQKYRSQAYYSQNQVKAKTTQLENHKEQINRKKTEIQKLRKQNLQLEREKEDLNQTVLQSQRIEAFLRSKLDKLEQQQKDYEQFRKYKKIMQQNSEQLLRFKIELESKETPYADMAKQFFQICQMCKLEEGKLKQNTKMLQSQLKNYTQEISKLKETIQRKEKDIMKIHQRVANQKKKTEQLENKYKRLKQKYISGEQKEDSNVLSNASRKLNIQKVKTNDSFIPTKIDTFFPTKIDTFFPTKVENLQHSIQYEVRKPSFVTGSKIGGLGGKKKDDKIRLK